MTTNTKAALVQALEKLLANFESQHELLLILGSPDFVAMRDQARAALSTAAQPPADGALNTIAAMFHSGEEIEGPDGLAMMVDMSVWNDALDAFDEISGDDRRPLE